MRIVSRHLATDNLAIMFPIVDILMLLKVFDEKTRCHRVANSPC